MVVLPLGAVLPPQLPPLVPQNPTRKTSFSNRGGSSPEALRYYGRRSQAVLPFGEWYYRLEQYYRGYFRGYFRSGPKTHHKSSGGRHGCIVLVPLVSSSTATLSSSTATPSGSTVRSSGSTALCGL